MLKAALRVAILSALLPLGGCLPGLKPDAAALGAAVASPVEVPECASCHKYPLTDINHQFHLRSLSVRTNMLVNFKLERPSGQIVCMDCHFGSIAHKPYSWYDTIWGRNGEPVNPEERRPTDSILFISPAIPGDLPIPAGYNPVSLTADAVEAELDSAARMGKVLSWLTALNHMNGKIDVEFGPAFVDAADTALHLTAYKPEDLSCSSIACHSAPRKTYRWASASMNLTGCPTLQHNPAVDTSCRYSPKQEP